MSAPYWLLNSQTGPAHAIARPGLVRADRRVVYDDLGVFSPLGFTHFWAIFGYAFERDKWEEVQAYFQGYGYDYQRILCDCDWDGRSWGPWMPGYQNHLAGVIDRSYDKYGHRSQLTLVGSRFGDRDGMRIAEMAVEVVMDGRQHKITGFEVVNEQDRLDKMSTPVMVTIGRFLRDHTPHLVALTAPANGDDEHNPSESFTRILDASKRAGVQAFPLHTRRKDHDFNWAQVRQGYDFAASSLQSFVGWNNEPPGLQSSVADLDSPRKTALMRWNSVICGAALFCNHIAQQVTGKADANNGRPENPWDVPGIDPVLRAVRRIDKMIPQGVENWRPANNGRPWHPMPFPDAYSGIGKGFWEGNKPGNVNKNYAAVQDNRMVEAVLGVKAPSDYADVWVGTAQRGYDLTVYDPETDVVTPKRIEAGQECLLEGRVDTNAGYCVVGRA